MLARLLLVAALGIAGPAAGLDPDKPFSQYVVDRWSVQEGFPQVSALQVAQGRSGYIWATTQSGLARFDGVRFETYNVRSHPQLLTNHLEVLLVHSDGSLWIGSTRGLVTGTGPELRVRLRGDAGIGPVRALAEAPDGAVWVGAEAGLFRLGDELEQLLDGPVLALLQDAEGVWAGQVGSLVLLTADARLDVALPDASARVEHLAARGGTIWIGTDRGLHRYQEGLLSQVPLPTEPADVEMLYVDRHDSLWVGTYEALVRIFPDDSQEIIGAEAFGFRPWIVSATEDHEGNLWLGSNTHSLMRLWDGWTRRYSSRQGLQDPFVWSIAADGDDGLWIGTNSGLSRLRDGRIESIVAGEALPDPAVYTLAPIAPGCVWVGTRGGLVRYCDGRLATPGGETLFPDRQINGVLADGPAYWVATDDGLALLEEDRLAWVSGFEGQSKRVRLVYGDAGGLLVGTEAGLFTVNDMALEPVAPETVLQEAFITAINRLPDGRLAVGTLGRGLFLGRPETGWIQVDDAWGLPDGGMFHIEVSGTDFMWVGGEVGAYRIGLGSLPGSLDDRPRPLAIQNLASTNRLAGSQPARCCNGAGLAKGLYADGSFWFPTLDGVLEIQPDKIARPVARTPVLIESVEVGGERRRVDDGSVRLAPRERDFAVHFTALTFQDPRNVIFRYRLNGYDEDWIWAGRRRTAYYTNLKPGAYRFEVEASLGAPDWLAPGASLELEITPTLPETWWFRALLGTALLALFGCIYLLRVREAERVRLHLERVVQDRTGELDQANRLLREANRKLEAASETDPLTGLKNRRFVQTRLETDSPAHAELFQAERMPMLMVLADIDHFKQVNDLHGHPAGDEVLKQFARLLLTEVRECDAAVRWGGEEFLLLLGSAQEQRASAVVERLRRVVERHRFDIEGATLIRMTCSFGAAPLVATAEDFQARWQLSLQLADRALYAVKQAGRNGWAVIENPGEVSATGDDHAIAQALDRALAERQVLVRASRAEISRLLLAGDDHRREEFR